MKQGTKPRYLSTSNKYMCKSSISFTMTIMSKLVGLQLFFAKLVVLVSFKKPVSAEGLLKQERHSSLVSMFLTSKLDRYVQ